MPAPRNRPKPLSDSEIEQIAAEIAAGRPPMVWFTSAAVGVPEGRSGKVMSLGDPSDGDFLQVKPTGSKDVLSFSPAEVTLAKPARPQPAKKAAAPAAPGGAATAPASGSAGAAPAAPTGSAAVPPAAGPAGRTAPGAAPGGGAVPARPSTSAMSGGTPSPIPKENTSVTQPTRTSEAPRPAASAEPKPRPAAKATARKAKAPEVSVTLSGTADGEWTVDVTNGKKRTVKGLQVSAAAVAQAAKILHPEVEEVVSGIMEAVRDAQQAKVAQLQAELEQARKLLEELSE